MAFAMVLLVSLASCAKSTASAPAAADDVAAKFGACQPGQEAGDFAPPVAILSSAERWLEATSLPSQDQLSSFSPDQGETLVVKLGVKQFDPQAGDFEGPSEDASIAIHSSMLPGATWALAEGGRVFIALASKDLNREMVAYTLVAEPGGGHFFAGECEYHALTSPLQALLGKAFDSTMDSLVGLSDASAITKLINGGGSTEPTPQKAPTILNPQDTDPKLLDSLSQVTLAVHLPDSWVGPYTICTQIPEGWNDCMSISTGRRDTTLLNVYTDETETLEVWLLDENADLVAPIQMLGAVDLNTVDPGILDSKLGGVVRVDLQGAFGTQSDGNVVSSARAVISDAATWETVLTNSARSIDVTGVDMTKAEDAQSGAELP